MLHAWDSQRMTGVDITKKRLTSSATLTADPSRGRNGASSFHNQGSVDKAARVLRQSSKVSFEFSHPTPIQDHTC